MSRTKTVLGLVILLLTAGLQLLPGAAFDRQHRLYALVLDRFVKQGMVDYAALKASPRDLNAYLDSLAEVPEAEFKSWTLDDQVAFLCNLYNAATLQLVIDNYPLKSLKDIGFLPYAAWRTPTVRFQGKLITLQSLEHEIIRAKYPTYPGIHFALVCAAKACPTLRSEPYLGPRLKAQLDEQAREFLADTTKNRVVAVRRTIFLSKIFQWYEEDFVLNGGSVLGYVNRYLPPSDQEDIKAGGFKIEYLDYDWSLNDLKSAKKK
jgi:hypothetical protein